MLSISFKSFSLCDWLFSSQALPFLLLSLSFPSSKSFPKRLTKYSLLECLLPSVPHTGAYIQQDAEALPIFSHKYVWEELSLSGEIKKCLLTSLLVSMLKNLQMSACLQSLTTTVSSLRLRTLMTIGK